MLLDKIRLLLKEVGINLTFSVSAYRSKPSFSFNHSSLGFVALNPAYGGELNAQLFVRVPSS